MLHIRLRRIFCSLHAAAAAAIICLALSLPRPHPFGADLSQPHMPVHAGPLIGTRMLVPPCAGDHGHLHRLPTAHIPVLILSAPHRAQITMGTFIVSFVGNGFVQSAQDWLPLRRFSPQTRRRLLVSLSGRGLG